MLKNSGKTNLAVQPILAESAHRYDPKHVQKHNYDFFSGDTL
jgi:hypothetical protein